MSATEVSGFDQSKKTCSIIFGNATQSQLRYFNASIELQQVVLTSCDSFVANQLKWIENNVRENRDSELTYRIVSEELHIDYRFLYELALFVLRFYNSKYRDVYQKPRHHQSLFLGSGER